MSQQPLNEAYQNEILEAYQKISDTFDDFTQLMRKRVPYEKWPDHCKIAGVSESLGCLKPGDHIQLKIGPTPDSMPIPDFPKEMIDLCQKPIDDLEKIILEGWWKVQSTCRPDESFRAMLVVMMKWKKYWEAKQEKEKCQANIWDVMKAKGLDPTKAFPIAMMSRLEDLGRAYNKLEDILDCDVFENLSEHSAYWHSDHILEEKKLDDLREKISCLNDNLWDLMQILRTKDER